MGEVFTNQGWEVIGLDASPEAKATICVDIRLWDYKGYPPGHFDVIWASPVCTHYSIARTNAKTPRNLEWADSLVLKTLEIIDYLNPGVGT